MKKALYLRTGFIYDILYCKSDVYYLRNNYKNCIVQVSKKKLFDNTIYEIQGDRETQIKDYCIALKELGNIIGQVK